MTTDTKKGVALPDDDMAMKGMSPEQRAEYAEKMRNWRGQESEE